MAEMASFNEASFDIIGYDQKNEVKSSQSKLAVAEIANIQKITREQNP